jgi:histone deacetylase 1/2
MSHYTAIDHLSPALTNGSTALSAMTVPKTHVEAMQDPGWRMAMDEEMRALTTRGTWDLADLPSGATAIDCRWVYTVKDHKDGSEVLSSA